ncbi:MAG: lysophospholipid acyltransferase family protein [Opitutaceae bacterium]
MQLFFTKLLGRACALCPERLLGCFSNVLGTLLYLLIPRRGIMLHSLACAFPEKSDAWRKNIARTSCIRLIETGLLSLAMPFLTEDRVRRMAGLTSGTRTFFAEYNKSPRPVVLGTVHLACWEGLTWLPFLLRPDPSPELLTIYRALRNPGMDNWLRQTRERFGVRLMARNRGLHAALHTLHRNQVVTLLFDQSAGSHGYLTRFLGRECSTTPLPGMLVEKSGASVGLIYARRLAFWRFEIDLKAVASNGTSQGVTLALNREFERMLRTDENLCASWLWLHQRWRILDRPEEKRKLEAKRGGLIG